MSRRSSSAAHAAAQPNLGSRDQHCAECSAAQRRGLTCWEQLGLLIAWEFDDPALQAEHFLTVASYNLQHTAQFTDEALAAVQAAFVEYLDPGLGIAEVRRRVGAAAESLAADSGADWLEL